MVWLTQCQLCPHQQGWLPKGELGWQNWEGLGAEQEDTPDRETLSHKIIYEVQVSLP